MIIFEYCPTCKKHVETMYLKDQQRYQQYCAECRTWLRSLKRKELNKTVKISKELYENSRTI